MSTSQPATAADRPAAVAAAAPSAAGAGAAAAFPPEGPDWDRRFEKLVVVVPWLLLLPATIISQLPAQGWADRMVTLGLVGLTATWVYAGHTRPAPASERGRAALLTYFVGLLVLAAVLMSRDQVFVLFTITGFFHAYVLRPWPVGVGGVFGTSVVLNTMTMGFPSATSQEIGIYAGVITIQTAAIGVGILISEKVAVKQRRREETLARLAAALEENAGLHAQLLTQAREAGVLDERQRMAHEIHDTLAQGLAGIITQVQAAQRVWDSPDRARPHVNQALTLARESLAEARRSVQALAPRQLETAQLPEAVSELAQRWSKDTGIPVHVEVTGDPAPLSPAIEVSLFRVAQESLTNVNKHAQATRVGLTLSYLGDLVLLDVRDDGAGMPAKRGSGFGITSMTQRIRTVGGTVEIESWPDEGTVISARVPAIGPGGEQ